MCFHQLNILSKLLHTLSLSFFTYKMGTATLSNSSVWIKQAEHRAQAWHLVAPHHPQEMVAFFLHPFQSFQIVQIRS